MSKVTCNRRPRSCSTKNGFISLLQYRLKRFEIERLLFERMDNNEQGTFLLEVHPKNTSESKIRKLLIEYSSPGSSKYGSRLPRREIHKIRRNVDAENLLRKIIHDHNRRRSLEGKISTQNVPFSRYVRLSGRMESLRTLFQSRSLPRAVSGIFRINPISQAPFSSSIGAMHRNLTNLQVSTFEVNPNIIREFYDIRSDCLCSGQEIGRCGISVMSNGVDQFSQSDLNAFNSYFGLQDVNVIDRTPDDENVCQEHEDRCFENNLDTQYASRYVRKWCETNGVVLSSAHLTHRSASHDQYGQKLQYFVRQDRIKSRPNKTLTRV